MAGKARKYIAFTVDSSMAEAKVHEKQSEKITHAITYV